MLSHSFSHGVVAVGACRGMFAADARKQIGQELLTSGDAILFYEPKHRAVSIYGDECVVKITNEWVLLYEEEDWKEACGIKG